MFTTEQVSLDKQLYNNTQVHRHRLKKIYSGIYFARK